ncbi:hypothetical protein HYDPIDRAFT_31047 [Hydnomerulius pinastri MD-312]|uniref:Zinc finger PHD-type domain-containing protein n=1 Tax=Hydnomerulius pinastri MD-312 TaxID=994086 RepID=A0A0C9VUL6_9AGAM|nr:hypothetical protein HYDPIDRAFT_31047 [Hydnomerulius pinastri MD-312]
MNSDATEAALGLLGLSPLNAPQSQPQPQPQIHLHTAHSPSLSSSSIGISIDRKSALNHVQSALSPSLVPLKRKQPSPALPTTTRGISPTSSTTPPATTSRDAQPVKPTPRQSSHPLASSSTPPIKATRPLPNVPTKSSAGTSQRHHQQRPFSPSLTTSHPPQTPPITQLPLTSPSTSQHPLSLPDPPPPPDSDAISCICGFTYDDGFSIACDDCSRWCHAACFGIVQGGNVPEYWKCWVCDPEVEVDKERAVKIQKGRLKAMRMRAGNGANGGPGGAGANGVGGNTGIEEGSANAKPTSRRKASPGVERKPRRGSAVAAAIDGSGNSKKKRRASILSPTDPSSSTSIMNPPPSNHASAAGHPQPSHASSSRISHPAPSISSHGAPPIVNARPTPVTLPPDVYPHPSTHAQLLRVAKAWRGVTALNPPSPLNINPPPRTYVDGEYLRVDDQGYSDRYGYSMSPLDNTTPVILDEHARDAVLPQTVLKTDTPFSSSSYPHPHSYSHLHPHLSQPPSSQTHTPPHLLRPPSPRYHVASSPSPYPTPPAPNGTHTSSAGPYPTPSTTSHPHTHTWSQHNPHTSTHTKSPLAPTTNTIPASTFLAPYTAAIVPSSAYLADPLNGYAHLGMGKPQVRLMGGGWGVGVDARQVGAGVDPEVGGGPKGDRVNGKTKESEETGTETGKARWARCGCWPNAVVRPVICGGTRRAKKGKGRRHRADCSRSSSSAGSRPPDESPRTLDEEQHGKQHTHDASAAPETDPDQEPGSTSDSDTDPTTLSFALFALRDLRADEEIVLGWEWDDGHAVHMLPALMESPGMFG